MSSFCTIIPRLIFLFFLIFKNYLKKKNHFPPKTFWASAPPPKKKQRGMIIGNTDRIAYFGDGGARFRDKDGAGEKYLLVQ